MRRRQLFFLVGLGITPSIGGVTARAKAARATLLSAPVELGGDWRGSVRQDAAAVIERMRVTCLAGVVLRSDRQPERLRVDDRPDRNPSIWLQTGARTTGWVNVVVGTRDWCNLAYQFGHELGHVLCNSWEPDAMPRSPCQWIEESLVEAFSLRGLANLADSWAEAPPFPNDAGYANSIRSYREAILARYRAAARTPGLESSFGIWFKAHEKVLSEHGGVDTACGAVPTMLTLLDNDATMIEDLGALNRWPGRSGVPLPSYLALWQNSCLELGAPGRLPMAIRDLLAIP